MSAAILDKIRQAGGTVAVVGGDLRVKAPKGLLSDQDRRLLVEHKADLVRPLADEPGVETMIEEPDLDRDETLLDPIDPPEPCQQCGSNMHWWDAGGRVHCQKCDPPLRSQELRKTARRLRRQARPSRKKGS